MKLVTYRVAGDAASRDRLGALRDDEVIELSGAVASDGNAIPDTLLELLRLAGAGLDRARAIADDPESAGAPRRELSSVELLAPLPRPNSLRDFMLVEEHVHNSLGDVPAEWY